MKTRLKKTYETICNGWEGFFMWFLEDSPTGFYRLSGLKHIVRKFQLIDDDNIKYPTGFLWAIVLYFTLYQVAVLNYQGSAEHLNRKVEQIIIGVDQGDHKYWLGLLPQAQKTNILRKPNIGNPVSTISSILGAEAPNPEIIQALIKVVESLGRTDKLQEANLQFANLEEANLSFTNLQEADFQSANLSFSNLEGANLKSANLVRTNLLGTNLSFANLKSANLDGANLRGANLSFSNFKSSNFEETNLEKTNLQFANLEGANLKSANLVEANLVGAENLNCNQINSVTRLNNGTQFPDYLEVEVTSENEWTCKEVKKKK